MPLPKCSGPSGFLLLANLDARCITLKSREESPALRTESPAIVQQYYCLQWTVGACSLLPPFQNTRFVQFNQVYRKPTFRREWLKMKRKLETCRGSLE
uniref:Uncharacterized protein n=1 Tax=Arundo donax TaxID=35708 RepID=A0A0A8YMX3_ARUDO